jgi:hypothetical protein
MQERGERNERHKNRGRGGEREISIFEKQEENMQISHYRMNTLLGVVGVVKLEWICSPWSIESGSSLVAATLWYI